MSVRAGVVIPEERAPAPRVEAACTVPGCATAGGFEDQAAADDWAAWHAGRYPEHTRFRIETTRTQIVVAHPPD
ncbi:DUF7848 domain-containing protein [Streptomyces buecherae]|uniref:DUF7848 domain-containing protein n=1 Tax=Streptomyces buecherae TaxID=2763006 RepID=UPI00164E093C|nr:hypothetical protein [Streptomyces buecherae]QNJ42001.1 hypothetical protein H7H31_21205 [Streptomyces buecherae]